MTADELRILEMLLAELRVSSPEMDALLSEALAPQPLAMRRLPLRQIGALWYRQGGEPEVLAELGLVLANQVGDDTGVILAELLMAYGAARDDERSQDWEAQMMQRMSELRGLHRVISAANSTLDLDTSLQTVVATVAEVMDVQACSVYLFDKSSENLILRAAHGLNPAAIGRIGVRVGTGVTGAAASDGRPVMVREMWRDSRFNIEPALGEEQFCSMLAVPIVLFSAERFHIGADKLQGVVNIQTTAERDFTIEEISFVETVAGELAFFIVNAQLFQQTDEQRNQKVRELTSLQQVSKRIAEQLDLQEVLKLIVANAVELAVVDRADILRYDDDGRLLIAASHGGRQPERVLEFISNAVREGRPLAVLNAYSDSRFPDLAAVAAQEGFCSLFCMPLHARGRTIGAVCLYTAAPRHFGYEQVRLLSTFADEAAIAIENARLYDESQRALAVKSAMLQEMHHRVRNNMQTISALLTMQLRRLSPGTEGASALRDSIARIQAIAGVHNLLSREDVGVTTVASVARQIVESARVSLVSPEKPIRFEVAGTDAAVGSRDATVLAIVLNELIANAMSHGLASGGGDIIVDTSEHDGLVTVEVRDNGPMHAMPTTSTKSSGLGLQIIRTLVIDDLEGRFDLFEQDRWMHARVTFPARMRTDV